MKTTRVGGRRLVLIERRFPRGRRGTHVAEVCDVEKTGKVLVKKWWGELRSFSERAVRVKPWKILGRPDKDDPRLTDIARWAGLVPENPDEPPAEVAP